ncbi:MAG: Smr/MutS family protein [Candidatus Krumholzibacteriota bacterium]
MGRKKGKSNPRTPTAGPRRGKRRSIRYEAEEQWPEEREEARKKAREDAPPSVHLRKLTVDEALRRLETQLQGFAGQKQREVLVIHGKGQGSQGGISVLGPEVRDWCDRHPALVSSWREAPARWGGSGAIVVVLNL